MPFSITCPGCEAKMNAPDEVAGKRIKCKSCGEAFVARVSKQREDDDERPRKAEKPSARPAPSGGSRQSRNTDDDEDFTPRKSQKSRPARRDEEDDDRSSKVDKDRVNTKLSGGEKLLVFALCILGLLMSAGSVGAAMYFLKPKESEQKYVDVPPPPGGAPKGAGGPGVKGGPAPKGGVPK